MHNFFKNKNAKTLTDAYQRLINDDNQLVNLPKIADYIRRGADTSAKNKQGITFLHDMLTACKTNTFEILYRKEPYPNYRSFTNKIAFTEEMTLNIASIVKAGHVVGDEDIKMAADIIELITAVDTAPTIVISEETHLQLMSAIDNLSTIDRHSNKLNPFRLLFN